MHVVSEQTNNAPYEAPEVSVLGSFSDLTLGTFSAQDSDGTLFASV